MGLNYLEHNYSTFPLVSLFFAGILISLLLHLIRFLIPYIAKNRGLKNWLQKYFSLFELFVWILLGLWFLPYLMEKHHFAGYGLAFILFAIFVWISWFGIKDLVAGFIFKSNSDLNINEHIRIGNFEGSIVKMGYRSLTLDTASGNFVNLPYSQILNESIVRISSSEIRHSISFELQTNKVENIQKISNEIAAQIMMHPRSSLVEKPKVELISEQADHLLFKVKIFAIENQFLSVIEEDLRNWVSRYNGK